MPSGILFPEVVVWSLWALSKELEAERFFNPLPICRTEPCSEFRIASQLFQSAQQACAAVPQAQEMRPVRRLGISGIAPTSVAIIGRPIPRRSLFKIAAVNNPVGDEAANNRDVPLVEVPNGRLEIGKAGKQEDGFCTAEDLRHPIAQIIRTCA